MQTDEELILQGIVYEQAVDAIGIYPAKINGVPRTEFQEGHNKCIMRVTENVCAIDDWIKSLDNQSEMIDALRKDRVKLSLDKEQNIKIYVWLNDVFYWAFSDREEIKIDEIKDLNACYVEVDVWGGMLWGCRKRKMRPQKPWFEQFNDKQKELFEACGPERDE